MKEGERVGIRFAIAASQKKAAVTAAATSKAGTGIPRHVKKHFT